MWTYLKTIFVSPSSPVLHVGDVHVRKTAYRGTPKVANLAEPGLSSESVRSYEIRLDTFR